MSALIQGTAFRRAPPTLGFVRCSRTIQERGWRLGKKIYVSAVDELGWLDAQAPHEVSGFVDTGVRRLVLAEDDLQLEEIAQMLHNIQMNPGPAG